MTISGGQLRRLLTLWGKLCRQGHMDPLDRELRLSWMAAAVDRKIASFKELTKREASKGIEAMQKLLPPADVRRKRTLAGSPDYARAKGTAGRKGRDDEVLLPVTAELLCMIEHELSELGWTRERLDAWLRSRSGPLGGRAVIRMLADGNRVHWALKRMVGRKGKMENSKTAA